MKLFPFPIAQIGIIETKKTNKIISLLKLDSTEAYIFDENQIEIKMAITEIRQVPKNVIITNAENLDT